MISAAFADQNNDTSKITNIAKTLNPLVASFTCKTPGNMTVGAAVGEEEYAQNKNAMIAS